MKNWREYTLGEISDEINEMPRTKAHGNMMIPQEDYVIALQALNTLIGMSGQAKVPISLGDSPATRSDSQRYFLVGM